MIIDESENQDVSKNELNIDKCASLDALTESTDNDNSLAVGSLAPSEPTKTSQQLESLELANHPTTNAKKPIKRSTMVAVGASITAVLLAAIITIVIIAVEVSSVMTTVFFTNYGYVASESRNNIFIASVNGEYSLFEGDKIIGDKYANLQWNDHLNGYIYTKVDGESGALDYSGNKLYTVAADNYIYSIGRAKFFTPYSATYVIDGTFKTIDFAKKAEVVELSGLTTIPNTNGNYFAAGKGGYVLLHAEKNVSYNITGSLVGSNAKFSAEGQPSTAVKVKEIQNKNAILELANTAIIFGENTTQATGDYYQIKVNKKRDDSQVLNIVGKNIYYSNLEFSGFSSDKRVYSHFDMIQIGDSVYQLKDDKLELKKAGAKLLPAKKGADYYYIIDDILYSSASKVLYTAKTPNNFAYLGNDIVIDGNIATTLDGKKTVENVISYTRALSDEILFVCDNGVYSINGLVYPATVEFELGKIIKVLPCNGGYFVRAEKGVYITSSETVLPNNIYPGGIEVIGDDGLINNIAAFAYNKIEVYTLTKNKTTLTGSYAYPNAKVEKNDKFGIVYSVNSNCGIIDLNGKLVAPQYSNVILQKDYMMVELGLKAYAVASLSGRLQTGYDYIAVKTYGEYISVIKTNLQACIINSSGKELYTNIRDIADMQNLEFKNGEWQQNKEYGYSYFLSNKGYKVMKYLQSGVK